MAATAGAAVNWLGNLSVEEAKFLYAVDQKVVDLQDELKWMTCFLQDVAVKRDRDARLREWIKQIVWMAYEAEDVIESFVLKVEENRRSGLMNQLKRYACFIRELILIHKVGSDIDALTLKISKLTSRLQTYGIKLTTEYDPSSVRRDVLLRKSYAHYVEDENNIVGMEKDVKIVTEQLLKENADGTDSKVVAICGMGGLGKTTLAKKIYHHHNVRVHFDEFAWACISQQLQIKSVLMELVRGLTSENADDTWTLDKLMERVHRVQRDKKCLIVLDDIWTNDAWDTLKQAFPNDIKRGGKLILTTRIQSTSHHVDLKAFVHERELMNDTEARQLLERKLGHDPSNIFGEEHAEEMKKLAKEMLKHCGGLPLAIVALGGILATKKSLDEWTATAANIKSLLSNVRAGDGLSCKEVLELSYYDLPMYLKPCFLYLGIFPEDAEIPVRKLIRLWVAEGFISTSFDEDFMEPQGTLEEVAETYLAELVDRSLVQVVSVNKSGRMKRCRIHDLVREVCLSEAAKEDFLKLVVANGSQPHSTSSSLFGTNTRRRCRRLAIHDEHGVDWPKILTDCASNNKFDPQHIKSLFIRDDYVRFSDESCQDSLTRKVLKPFKSLRVLDLGGVRATALLKEVGDLVQLRYLSIRDSDISILPSSIENLRNLRTLDLRFTGAKLPPFVIWIRMRQLRHLYMPVYGYWIPEDSWKEKCRYTFDRLHMLAWEDSLKNTTLETIKDVYPCHAKYLTQCSNLRKLCFDTWKFMEKEELEHMTNPQSLLCGCLRRLRLKVEWDVATGLAAAFANFVHLNEMQLKISHDLLFDGSTSLKSGMLHHSITTLEIAYTRIENTDAMQILGRLPNLRELWLLEYSYIGKHMTCSQQGFPKLTFLHLAMLKELEGWTIEEGAMSSLQKLEIRRCYNLRMLWFEMSKSMEKEELEHMTNPQSLLCGRLKRLRLHVEWDAATRLVAAFADFVHRNEMQLEISHKQPFDGSTSLKSGMLHDIITTLYIRFTRIENTDAMQILGRLPNLRELWLLQDSYIGKHMTCSQQGFPKLTFLCVRDLVYLEGWTIEEGAMMSLRRLEIESCPRLEMIPDGIKSIRSLQVLSISDMPKSFTDRVSKRSEATGEGHGEDDDELAKQVRGFDFHKVEHIPYVSIDGRKVVF